MTSTPGQILLSGIVVLAKPRPVDPSKGNRNIAFDVNLPVDDGAEHQTLGLLRYFIPESRINDLERVWQDDFTQAFIISKIATMPNSGIPSALISEDDLFEYAFIGDITDIILTDHVDIQHNPCIVASGSVTDFDSSNFTFSLNPSQYINLPHSSLDCHLFCFFDSESKKWKNKKPMPTTGSTISITGFLTRVKRGFDQNRTLHIELDNIAYLSRTSTSGPSASLSQQSPITPSSRRTGRFNYRAPRNDASPSSPSPISLGKRKTIDDDDVASSTSQSQLSPIALGKRKATNDQDTASSPSHIKRSHTDSSSNNNN